MAVNGILALILLLCLAISLFCLLAKGEMCSATTRASAGEDPTTLQDRAFAAFRAECRGKDEMKSCSFFTEGNDGDRVFTFIIGPLMAPFRLNFAVKTEKDALIALAGNPNRTSIFVDLAIGGGGNTESLVRACHFHDCNGNQYVYSETGILSAEESRPFWIEFKEGVVKVGKGGKEEAFLKWNAAEYHDQVFLEAYVGIASVGDVFANWVFYQFCP